MNTYRKIYMRAKELCKKERLHLIEAELKNDGIIMWFHKDYIIINSVYKGKKLPADVLKQIKFIEKVR